MEEMDVNEINQKITNILGWLCPCSTAILSVGLVSNILSMAAFMDGAFGYMPFATNMLFHCLYNILFLFFSSLRTYSLLPSKKGPPPLVTCVTLNWVYQTIDEGAAANLLLLQWNRYKAIRRHDVARTKLDTIRLPIILNVAALILSTVPASIYREHASTMNPFRNSTLRCAILLVCPYSPHHQREWFMGFIAVVVDGMIFLMIIVIAIKILVQVTEQRRILRKSLMPARSRTDTKHFRTSSTEIDLKRLSESLTDLDDIYNDPKPENPDPTETVCISNNGRPVVFSDDALKERDDSMTGLTFVMTISYLLCEMPQRLPISLFFDRPMQDWLYLAAGLELLRMAKLAVEFFMFRCCSGLYRKRSDEFFQIEEEAPFYTDMDLAFEIGLLRRAPKKREPRSEKQSQDIYRETQSSRFNVEDQLSTGTSTRSTVVLEDFTLPRDVLRLQHVDLKNRTS